MKDFQVFQQVSRAKVISLGGYAPRQESNSYLTGYNARLGKMVGITSTGQQTQLGIISTGLQTGYGQTLLQDSNNVLF